jgi:hypothetical protein
MKPNKIILFLIAFYPFVAFLAQTFFNLHVQLLLLSIIVTGLFLNFFVNKEIKRPSNYTLYYFLFIAYATLLDFTRDDLFGSGYNLLFTLPLLFYLDQVKINESFKNVLNKYLIFVVLISVLVIFIQQVYRPNFFVSTKAFERIASENIYTQRLPSIYTWVSATSNLFSFAPLLSIVVGEYINKRNIKLAVYFAVLGLVFAFLAKGRATVLYVLIVVFQLFLYSGIRISKLLRNSIISVILILVVYNMLIIFGIPLDDILFYRFFEGGRDLENTSVYARIKNFNFFFKNVKDFWLFGAGNEFSYSLKQEMDRKSNAMLLGMLDPFFRYGVFGAFFYFLFLTNVIKKFYKTARLTANWGPFLGIMGFVAVNFTANAIHFFQIGLIFLLVYEKFYRQQFIFHQIVARNKINKPEIILQGL